MLKLFSIENISFYSTPIASGIGHAKKVEDTTQSVGYYNNSYSCCDTLYLWSWMQRNNLISFNVWLELLCIRETFLFVLIVWEITNWSGKVNLVKGSYITLDETYNKCRMMSRPMSIFIGKLNILTVEHGTTHPPPLFTSD